MAITAEAAPAKASRADREALDSLYLFEDAGAVRQYLDQNPDLTPLLREAPAQIARVFGANVPVRLRIYRDAEYPVRPELHAHILLPMRTEAEWDEADNNLRRLHAEWLIALPRPTTMKIHFSAEPR